MKNVILIFLLSCPVLLFSQGAPGQKRIDSLQSEMSKFREDTNKAKLILSIAKEYLDVDPDSSIKYGKFALAFSNHLGFKFGVAASRYILGSAKSVQGNASEALRDLTTAIQLFENVNDKKWIGKSTFSLGTNYFRQDDLPKALECYFKAMEIYEEAGDRYGIASCYLNIGNVYNVLKDYDKALEYLFKSLNIANEIRDPHLQELSLQNIASIKNLQGNANEALKYALQALDISKSAYDNHGIATCYKVLGNIYTIQGNQKDALRSFVNAQGLLEHLKENMSLADVYGGIGVIYVDQKKYAEAEKYFIKAQALAEKIGSLSILEAADETLSELYSRSGDYKKSLDAYKASIVVRDSIFRKDNSEKIARLEMQYEYDKKEALARAEQERKLQRKNVFIIGTILAFLVLILVGVLLSRQSRLKAKHKIIDLEQKQLRARMNPHFIFNCLNSIQHFVVANDVKNANKYLSGFAMLMRQTLENSKMSTIRLRDEIAYLKNYLSLQMLLFEDKFVYEISCDESLDQNTTEIPTMIIQPFVENAICHGLCYLKDRAGWLKIDFHFKEGVLYCMIDDNGVGRENAQKLKNSSGHAYKSQGMDLTRQRLALVSKSYGSDYEISIVDKVNEAGEPEGTTITIKFPVNI